MEQKRQKCIKNLKNRWGTYQSHKNTQNATTIITDQSATANICILLFRGILDGTKLRISFSMMIGYQKKEGTMHSIFACRAATGFNGVVFSFDSLSRREDADK